MQPAQGGEVAGAAGGRDGGERAERRRVAARVHHRGERPLVETNATAPGADGDGDGGRPFAQPPRQRGDVIEHLPGAAGAGACADEAHALACGAEPIQAPWVEIDRIRAAQHDGPHAGGVAHRVDGHQVRAVGLAPQIERAEAELRADGLEVVGHRRAAVVPHRCAQLAPARADRVDEPRARGEHDRWVERAAGQLAGAAGAPRVDEQQVPPVQHRREALDGLRGADDRRHPGAAGVEEDGARGGLGGIAARDERERDRRGARRRVRPIERDVDAAAQRRGHALHPRARRERRRCGRRRRPDDRGHHDGEQHGRTAAMPHVLPPSRGSRTSANGGRRFVSNLRPSGAAMQTRCSPRQVVVSGRWRPTCPTYRPRGTSPEPSATCR